MSFELLTDTVGAQALLLRCSDLPFKVGRILRGSSGVTATILNFFHKTQ